MYFEIPDGRHHYWQWDTGQRLIVCEPDEITSVHMATRDGRTVAVTPYLDGDTVYADIPDGILIFKGTLDAYAYISDGSGGYTKKEEIFTVVGRPKPSDYVEPDDVPAIQQIVDERIEENAIKKPPDGTAGQVLTLQADGSAMWQDTGGIYTAGSEIDITDDVISCTLEPMTDSEITNILT